MILRNAPHERNCCCWGCCCCNYHCWNWQPTAAPRRPVVPHFWYRIMNLHFHSRLYFQAEESVCKIWQKFQKTNFKIQINFKFQYQNKSVLVIGIWKFEFICYLSFEIWFLPSQTTLKFYSSRFCIKIRYPLTGNPHISGMPGCIQIPISQISNLCYRWGDTQSSPGGGIR